MKKEILNSIPKFIAESPMYLDKKDHRFKDNVEQLERKGFCNAELWGLNYTIACFIYPRLKEFRAQCGKNGYPVDLTPNKWAKVLDDILYFFESEITDNNTGEDRNQDRISRGKQLFIERFDDLWL